MIQSTKKMTTTVAQAFKWLDGLKRLETLDINVPIEIGLPIMNNLHWLQSELVPALELRDKTILKFSNGKNAIDKESDPEKYAACMNELEKLGNAELEVQISMIDMKKLKLENAPIWAFFALDFMVNRSN